MNSKIEWTGTTWNPITGCSKISMGCFNCYAARLAHRYAAMKKQKKYVNEFDVTLHDWELETPSKWRKPRTVFVCSMSDIFHKDVPPTFIQRIFDTMKKVHQHQFQVLTKRAERLAELAKHLPWPTNVWMGVTVESADYIKRIDYLCSVPAAVRFLSIEPLLGPISNLNLSGIDWVIVGGEAGPKARPMKKEWALDIRDQCVSAGVPFFFKQFGKLKNNPDRSDPTARKNGGGSKGGRMLDGRIWDEMPKSTVLSPRKEN